MANIDNQTKSESDIHGTVELVQKGEANTPELLAGAGVPDTLGATIPVPVHTETTATEPPAAAMKPSTSDPQQPRANPTLVQLTTSSISPAQPQPKRFSASNINKKFLEKTSSTGVATSTTTATASKQGTSTCLWLFLRSESFVSDSN